MQMYGGREIIRQPRLSSSHCSSFSSSSPESPEYLMGNGSNTTSTASIRRTHSAQVPSMLNEDMIMSPSTSSIQPTPITTMANSFNQLDNFNQMTGHYNGAHGGTSASAAGALPYMSFQLTNEDHLDPSSVTHDQHPRAQYPCLYDGAPYFTSTIVADSSTPLPSISEPITPQQKNQCDQAYIDHTFFSDHESMVQSFQCACNASCNGELDESYGMNIQLYAHETGGLGCSHGEEAIAVQQNRSCSQLLKYSETSQISASLNTNQQPEWASMYSNIDIYGHHLSAPSESMAHEVSGGTVHDFSTVLSTSPAQTPGKYTRINQGLMGSVSTVSEAYHDTFSHKHMPNHDQGVQMAGFSTRLAPTSCSPLTPVAAATYTGDYDSADKADDQRMHQESIRRINELIKRGSSGQSNMQAQYMIRNSSGVQDQPQEIVSYVNCSGMKKNVSSSTGTPQNEAATLHMIAERKRRRKHGDCIKILSTLVPIITKRKDKVTILESTIEYIKGIQALACKNEKDTVSLGNRSNKDYEGEMETSCNSQHAKIVINSSHNIITETKATCKYIHFSNGQEILPHFQLCLNSSVKTLNANVPTIEIISALQKKSLYCVEFKSEFSKSTSRFVVKILATYKNGTPNMDEIQHIKQWWTHLVIDQLSVKWKL